VILENTTLVVIWGADLLNTNKVDSAVPDHDSYAGMKELKKKGIEVIVVDPVRTRTADYFNSCWIAPRPGTDVALMMGIAHTLYVENVYDQDFLNTYTVGFDRFRSYLTGETDGLPKNADWAAGITQIPAYTIRYLARKMAANRTMLMSGWSLQRQDHGEQAHWMLITLAGMLGQIGTPGGGFGLSYHMGGGIPIANAPSLDGIPSVPASSPLVSSPAIPVARVSDLLMNPGKTIDYNGGHITYPDIKMVYWVGGNPFHHHQDRNRLIRAWRRPQTIVIHDIYWTATAKFADIVLPATTSYERNDIDQIGIFSRKFIVAMHKIVDPVFDARSDFDIFAEISQRLGYADAFSEGKTEMEWIRSFYAAAQQSSPVVMPDFDTFWNQLSQVEFPVPESSMNFVRYEDFRRDPQQHPLSTPSGKIEIYSETIESFGYDDCPPFPTWIEPIEWLGSRKAKQYPLHLVSSHPEHRLHSQLNQTTLRKKYEIKEREPIWIHPQDAKARGIRTGDVVRVFNDRGQVLAGAKVIRSVLPGVVRLQEGSWYDPLQGGVIGTQCKHGDANVLTIDKGSSRLSQGNIAHTCLIEVERYCGPLPQVTCFSPPDGT
jgi:trimethylamine-N-oxide reductase (cytochrome c)